MLFVIQNFFVCLLVRALEQGEATAAGLVFFPHLRLAGGDVAEPAKVFRELLLVALAVEATDENGPFFGRFQKRLGRVIEGWASWRGEFFGFELEIRCTCEPVTFTVSS